jgi:serine/threonine-protein kinase
VAAPERIGEYDVLGELGRGAMGVVYRARKASLPDREVALKEVPLGVGDAERTRRMREARTLLRMHSVHIVQLHDVFECAERASLCIVMERLRAETLRDRITSLGGPMDVDEALSTIDQILDAVEAAHGATDDAGRSSPVVHRDLKPENIGYQDWRKGEIVKVMDFGIARVVEGDAGAAPHATVQAYTPAYASPEVLHGETATTAADIFAVGEIFWEILVGRHPYSDAKGKLPPPTGLLGRIMTEPVAPLPAHLLPRLPEAVVDLVKDMCAKDPRLRPNAHEARERLTRGMSAATATASKSVSRTAPVSRPAPKSGGGKTVAVLVILLLVLGGGGAAAWFLYGRWQGSPLVQTISAPPAAPTAAPFAATSAPLTAAPFGASFSVPPGMETKPKPSTPLASSGPPTATLEPIATAAPGSGLVPVAPGRGVARTAAPTTPGPATAARGGACINTCRFANDGECDDGRPGANTSLCARDTDCNDCRSVVAPGQVPVGTCGNSCRFASDGECDDGRPGAHTRACPLGTDCTDCGPINEPLHVDAGCQNSCRTANDGECDDGRPGSVGRACARGTDCNDCRAGRAPRAAEPAATAEPSAPAPE